MVFTGFGKVRKINKFNSFRARLIILQESVQEPKIQSQHRLEPKIQSQHRLEPKIQSQHRLGLRFNLNTG